ncbi:MAG TPA: hypothetical protein DIW43_14880 [Spongiibacteraceae bacterium]|nr:hypothetical protein [Spongiibacteraceae bacterium]HCS28740.1 hypothetical protein [Spongiibacteraceae bacterium]
MDLNRDLHFEVEQFYYREARLLDDREYQQWLALLSEDICYVMPSRYVAQRDHALRGTEAYLSPEREMQTETASDLPLREENYFVLAVRVDRAFKPTAWGDNPPARTRRHVSNVELLGCEGDELKVVSNFMLNYSRHGQDNFLYSGQRRDCLRREGGSFKVASREIILDWNVITAPTVALFF